MLSRRMMIVVVLGLAAAFVLPSSPAAHAAPDGVVLAQQPNRDAGLQGGDAQDEGGGAGQDDPDAETGAGQGETEGGTSAEATGPPWTYQMARITLALLVPLALGLGYLYFRLVASRRRGEV